MRRVVVEGGQGSGQERLGRQAQRAREAAGSLGWERGGGGRKDPGGIPQDPGDSGGLWRAEVTLGLVPRPLPTLGVVTLSPTTLASM